jgi:PhnB protein
MKTINPYLTFNGNCREAMTFYQECLGGELVFQTVSESPLASKMPSAMKKSILHSSLSREGLVIMATDMVWEEGLIRGNSVSLMLDCSSEEETRLCYDKLSSNGNATHPLHISFWGALLGDLTDKFGNQWLVHFDSRQVKKK